MPRKMSDYLANKVHIVALMGIVLATLRELHYVFRILLKVYINRCVLHVDY